MNTSLFHELTLYDIKDYSEHWIWNPLVTVIFHCFMYWQYMSSQMTLLTKSIVTLATGGLNSLIEWLYMNTWELRLPIMSKYGATLFTTIHPSLFYWLYMICKFTLGSKYKTTLVTVLFHRFMYWQYMSS